MSLMVLSVTDNILIGNYNSYDLASVVLGLSVWIPLSIFYEGVLKVCIPIISMRLSKRNKENAINIIYDIIFISLVMGLVFMFILSNSEILLNMFGTPKELIKLTKEYLQIITFSAPIICLYQGLRAFCEGYKKNTLIMLISLMGVGIHIPINYVLIYGKLGFTPMGAIGCGWATAISMCFMCICLFIYLHLYAILKFSKLLRTIFAPNIPGVIYLLKLGIPIGLNSFIESAIIATSVLLLSSYGEIIISSYEIVLNINYLILVSSQSLSIVLIIRVSEKIGANKYNQAKLVAYISIIQAFILSVILVLLVFSNSTIIAALYTKDTILITSIVSLIPFLVALNMLDSLQVIFNGILYVYSDTLAICTIFVLSYCIVTIPLGYTLSTTSYITEPMAAKGFLYALMVGTILNIVLSLARIYQNIKKKRHLNL